MKRGFGKFFWGLAGLLSLILFLVPDVAGAPASFQTRSVPPEQIREAAVAYLAHYLPWPRENVEIKEIVFPQEILVPAGKLSFEFGPPSGDKTFGSLSLPAQVRVDQNLVRRFRVTATVEVYRLAVAAAKPIARGQILGAGDVYLRRMSVRELLPNTASEISKVVEKKARRFLQAHQVINETFLENQTAVRKGEVVKLVVESPSLHIETPGKTVQDGGVGEVIRVLNLGSHKEVYGRVLDSKTVQVEY
ncbi:MAG TPA: flagellar basal body P-ring formation chaperone FlgA [bacterium]|nr:flagellar basal body P-ring formation chaperone FlgA [bacterium]